MGRYSGYLICSDIDGTLADGDYISRENLDAISYFQSEGGLFTVATGRYAHYVERFPFTVNAPVIAVNGAAIYDLQNERLLHSFRIDRDVTEVLAHIYSLYGKDIEAHDLCFIDGETSFSGEQLSDSSDASALSARSDEFKHVFRFYDEEKARLARLELLDSFGSSFNFFRGWPQGLEMFSLSAGKGPCLKLMKNKFCEGIHTAIGIGDFENDVTMMADADISYAVANACDEAKALAKRQAPHFHENAVAWVIEDILK